MVFFQLDGIGRARLHAFAAPRAGAGILHWFGDQVSLRKPIKNPGQNPERIQFRDLESRDPE